MPNLPLVPENDPTTLFISAGMQPLAPYLLGEKNPLGRRLVSLQRCVRTGDIDDVGDAAHLTFFEMLGNWSLGDYFKKEALTWSWEFVTQELGLDPNCLSVTIFKGDDQIPYDSESEEIWLSLGLPRDRVYALGREDNWWEGGGENAPGGPDSEIFYDTGKLSCGPDCRPSCPNNCGRYFEIWNNVFMTYRKQEVEGKKQEYVELPQKNVDTGLGIERTIAVLSGLNDNYQSEIFTPLIKKIEEISGKTYFSDNKNQKLSSEVKDMRIIIDHLRAATFIVADGTMPSNVEQGYVLRRLIRRAVRRGFNLGIKEYFTKDICQVVIEKFCERYPFLKERGEIIKSIVEKEEIRFSQTLEKGINEFEKLVRKQGRQGGILSGQDTFYLYESFGFPIEMIEELATEKGIKVERVEFDNESKRHQEVSRVSQKGKFAGGLSDQSKKNTQYHTATHLLHQSLRTILGDSVQQRGSNITPERLRFDFSYPQKLTAQQLQQVEDLVNQKIQEDLKVITEVKTYEEAKAEGALAFFGEKYPDRVKVYTIGNFSKEVCGGPHVEHTGELSHFKIIKEESVSYGVRRIKAILEER